MNDKMKFKWSSDLSTTSLSSAKELAKIVKESGLTVNQKSEGK